MTHDTFLYRSLRFVIDLRRSQTREKERFPIDRSLPTKRNPKKKTPSGQKLIYPL